MTMCNAVYATAPRRYNRLSESKYLQSGSANNVHDRLETDAKNVDEITIVSTLTGQQLNTRGVGKVSNL